MPLDCEVLLYYYYVSTIMNYGRNFSCFGPGWSGQDGETTKRKGRAGGQKDSCRIDLMFTLATVGIIIIITIIMDVSPQGTGTSTTASCRKAGRAPTIVHSSNHAGVDERIVNLVGFALPSTPGPSRELKPELGLLSP